MIARCSIIIDRISGNIRDELPRQEGTGQIEQQIHWWAHCDGMISVINRTPTYWVVLLYTDIPLYLMHKYVCSSCHSHRHTPPLHQPHHPASPSHTKYFQGSSQLVVQGYSLGQSWQRLVDLVAVTSGMYLYYGPEITQGRGGPYGTPKEFTSPFSQAIFHIFLNHSRVYSPLHCIISAVTLSTPASLPFFNFLTTLLFTAADIYQQSF